MKESNMFNGGSDDFLNESTEESLEYKLILKDYKILRLIKEGPFLDKVLDREEPTNYGEKLLNLCCYMNLALSSVSYINNIIDLAETLSKGSSNIDYIDCLVSANLDNLKESFSAVGYSSAIGNLLNSSPVPSEKYNSLISSYYNFDYNKSVDRNPLSFVVGGVSFSKLLNLKDVSLKVLELHVDVCKDLRYSLENKLPINLEKYNELCCSVIGCGNSLFSQFYKIVSDIKLILSGDLGELDYLRCSRSLVDHFGYLDDCLKVCNRVISEANIVRKSGGFGGRKCNLVVIDFKVN